MVEKEKALRDGRVNGGRGFKRLRRKEGRKIHGCHCCHHHHRRWMWKKRKMRLEEEEEDGAGGGRGGRLMSPTRKKGEKEGGMIIMSEEEQRRRWRSMAISSATTMEVADLIGEGIYIYIYKGKKGFGRKGKTDI